MLEVQPSSSEAVHKAKKTERFPGRLDGEAAALGGSDFVLQALQGTCALALGVEFPGGLSSFTSCVLGMLPEQMCRGKGLKGAKSMEMSRACVCVGLLGVHKCISACCQTLISVQLPLGAVNNKVSRTGMTALICGTACPFASLEDWSAELYSVHCDVRCPPSALPAPVGTCRAWFAAAALRIRGFFHLCSCPHRVVTSRNQQCYCFSSPVFQKPTKNPSSRGRSGRPCRRG